MASHVRNLYFWQRNQTVFKPNSVILITGAGSGIGLNCALVYAKRQCKLVLVDINQSALNEAEKRIKSINNNIPILTLLVDVTDYTACELMINTVIQKYGSLDILLLCAGIGAHHIFSLTPDLSIFHRLMSVNFYGYLNCIKSAHNELIKSTGLLIAITSFSGEVGLPYRTAYCASKFAVTGFLEALRSEMTVLAADSNNQSQYHITIVCPPTVNTNLRKNSLTPDPSLKDLASKDALSVEDCAVAVVDAGDRRLRKAFFPLKSFLASYLRPVIPNIIDSFVFAKAKL